MSALRRDAEMAPVADELTRRPASALSRHVDAAYPVGSTKSRGVAMLKSHVACEQCGQPIKLRSFQLPPRTCPECGGLCDAEAARENVGCLVLFPVAIVAMAAFGFIGVLVGRALAPFVNDPELEWRLGFLAAFDGLGIVSLVHVVLFQGEKSQRHLHSVAFLSFVLIGMKCGHGHGVGWLFFTGIANGFVSSGISFAVLTVLRRLAMKDRGSPSGHHVVRTQPLDGPDTSRRAIQSFNLEMTGRDKLNGHPKRQRGSERE